MIQINSKLLLLLGAVVILVVVAVTLFTGKPNNQATQQINNTNISPSATQASGANNQAKITNVELTSNGFVPASLKVKIGTQIVWTNKSGTTATVNSDVHPTHLLWPFLNLGSFDDGKSVSVVFDKAGTYTYHNHFNPSQKGTVIVE